MKLKIAILLTPFLGTALGAAMVLFMKSKMNPILEKFLMGFASGVMVAASLWSLLIPAVSMAEEQGDNAWFPAAVGFLSGVGFLLLLDRAAERLPAGGSETNERTEVHKTIMLVLAVALHNLPEGMAVGVAFVGAMLENTGIAMAGVLALAVGIAIQNLPEGAIVSLPLRNVGVSKPKAFWYGVLSGVVEPVGTVATVLLAEQAVRILPYLLAFAAGAMIYVVTDELIPEAQAGAKSKTGTIGVALGFVLMMVLDVALG